MAENQQQQQLTREHTFLSVEPGRKGTEWGSNIVYSKEADGSTYQGNYRTDRDSIISPLHYLLEQ